MRNKRIDHGRIMTRMLKGLGLVGILGTVGATLLITPLAGSGCSDNTGGAGGNAGLGGHVGTGGNGGVTGTGGMNMGIGGTTTDGGVDAAATPTTATASVTNIAIQNFAYVPNNVIVHPGATITVHNLDTVAHTLTSEAAMGNFTAGGVAGVSFNTGTIAPSGTATLHDPSDRADRHGDPVLLHGPHERDGPGADHGSVIARDTTNVARPRERPARI